MIVGFGVCVGSWDKLQANVVPHVRDRPLLGISGQTCIAVAYNMILDAYKDASLDMLVLQHDDLRITDSSAIKKFLAVLSNLDVALVGVAGGRGLQDLSWWNHSPIGHQDTDTRPLDFGQRTGEVDALEGSILVLSPWAIDNLRFDVSYPGFHGYDCDISMQARRLGKKVVVADVDTHHHSTLGFKSASIQQEWEHANTVFQAKWKEGSAA